MNPYVQEGKVVNWVVPAGGCTVGVAIIAGTMVGIPLATGLVGETVALQIEGVFELPLKSGGAAPVFGDVMSFDVATDDVAIGAGLTGDINAACKCVANGAAGTDAFLLVKLTPATGVEAA